MSPSDARPPDGALPPDGGTPESGGQTDRGPDRGPGVLVLLDRDGTIIEDRHYLSDPDGVALVPGAAEGLRRLRSLGAVLAVVSNQSGVERGYYTEDDVARVNERVREVLHAEGVDLDGWYHCPHAPAPDGGEACACRKPQTGLAEQARLDLGACPADKTFVIGDKSADVELGRNLGARSVLVLTGQGREHRQRCEPDFVAANLIEAAAWIADRADRSA